ncbi:uroporphyrinogen-III synthase [Ferruginibacter albus]|uniref:uroporphyrinogen-III synthase n=1 Tax=Ferruginibacter albus TaxID=2875540 RepID=UPI001CC6E53B|nr:uroporphyrinogen-III synthase [Ferruginibacter albus]UAY51707.1 uroporphyrinogen-III synthase [Ferruginibacter albus]
MVKNGEKHTENKAVKKILITQPKPEGEKSPYFDLARKYDIELHFHPFIIVEGIPAKEFRKQKIDIPNYTAVIFTSRNAIDHFFRICEEMKISISQDTKYFCITEAVALYLQKFILYRKRKVFYGADGSNKSLFDVINKHKENEKFLYPTSESFDSEITNWLKSHHCEYATPVLYRIISNDIKEVIARNFDVICFFTPGGVKSLLENFPKYKQNGTKIGAFGANTFKAAEDAGLTLDIKAPQPQAPSMVSALELFLASLRKK